MTPTPQHVEDTARSIRRSMDRNPFWTLTRGHLTQILREASRQPTTRMKEHLATQLTAALLRNGIRVSPDLMAIDQYGYVRLYRVNSIPASMLDMIERPDPAQDRQLSEFIKKIKGEWRWDSDPENPAA